MKLGSIGILLCSAALLFAETCPTQKVETTVTTELQSAKAKPAAAMNAPRTAAPQPACARSDTLTPNNRVHFIVYGQGVAPTQTISPAQAFALAKRAAIADGYRLLGEKIAGVQVDGRDQIRDMMVNHSTIRTQVNALIQNARILNTKFEKGLCEVEMEVTLDGKEWYARFR